MKSFKYLKLYIALLIFIANLGASNSFAQPSLDLSAASFNVHYLSERRPRLPWEERRHAVLSAIKELNADIIGFQEMETWRGRGVQGENIQLQWLLSNFPEYSAAAIGNPEVFPDTQPIFYLAEEFEVLEQGFFYFSDTPDLIYSRPWEQSFPQFASWVEFRDLTSAQTFRVVNLHFDHSSKINRHGAAELVTERIKPWLDLAEPVVVLGDFNALSWFKTIDILEDAGLELADRDGGTFHFNKGIALFPAIDHVLFSGFDQQGETLKLDKKYDGVWPSDHYPIRVDLNLKAPNNLNTTQVQDCAGENSILC